MFKRCYFVIAPNFHGATLLSKLLNDHPKVMSLGDTYPRNDVDQLCGCGELVSSCSFWQKVGSDIKVERYRSQPHWLPDYPEILGGGIDRLLYNSLSMKRISKLIPNNEKKIFAADFRSFLAAVHEYSGRQNLKIFVDGVKSISRVYALAASGIKIDGVIHIQRNPGDFIQSTMKQPGFSRRDFGNQLVNYRLFHNRARRISREFPYLSLTYEGLAQAPETTLDNVFRFIGVDPVPLSKLIDEGRTRPWHFMGNDSLMNFDGCIRPSHHVQTLVDRMAARILAGPYDAESLHLTVDKV